MTLFDRARAPTGGKKEQEEQNGYGNSLVAAVNFLFKKLSQFRRLTKLQDREFFFLISLRFRVFLCVLLLQIWHVCH